MRLVIPLVLFYIVAVISYFYVLTAISSADANAAGTTQKRIAIKDPAVLSGLMLKTYDSKLVDIVRYLSTRYPITFTESYRKGLHTGDLHSTDPVRAVDLRSWIYTDSELESLILEVNTLWEYDSTRPSMKCCVLHDSGGGKHLHLQVHPRTKCTVPEINIRDKI